jgi:hypothetical protein
MSAAGSGAAKIRYRVAAGGEHDRPRASIALQRLACHTPTVTSQGAGQPMTTRSGAVAAILLLCGACGPPAEHPATERRALALEAALAAAPARPQAAGVARELWTWTTGAFAGGIIALAPVPGGGIVALASTPMPLDAPPFDRVPTHIGWFSAAGELLGYRSLAVGAPVSVPLESRPLAVTRGGEAVLAVNVTCDGGACPDLGAGPMSPGAHVLRFSSTGEVRQSPLGDGHVEWVAVGPGGAVLAGLSTGQWAVIRCAPADTRDPGPACDFPVSGEGSLRLAFLGDGTLVVARGSKLRRLGVDGSVLWTLDGGAPWEVHDLVASGDLIAVTLRHPTEPGATVQLDATGQVRWATRIAWGGVAIDPGGAVAVTEGDVVLFDADGTFQWAWFNPFPVYPPPFAAAAVAFHDGRVVAGGWKNGRIPFISLIGP